MKIKKHGSKYSGPVDQKKYEKFKCDKCGCEFSCESDEYYEDLGGADWIYSGISASTSTYYRTTVKDYLVCSCPECHKIVKKIRERRNDFSLWSSTSSTSLNELNETTNTTNSTSNAATEYTFTCKLDDSNIKEVKEALL